MKKRVTIAGFQELLRSTPIRNFEQEEKDAREKRSEYFRIFGPLPGFQ